MNAAFNDRKSAHNHAQALANAIGRDYGIKKGQPPFERGKFIVISLPDERNRYGHELTCEVVSPTV